MAPTSRGDTAPAITGSGPRPFLGDLSIGSKLTLITSIVSLAALLLIGTSVVAYDFVRFRGDVTAELETLADVIGTNSAGAVLFDDVGTAEEVLAALAAVDHVESAAIYDNNGAVFARYTSTDQATSQPPTTVAVGITMPDGRLAVARALTFDGEVLGIVYVRSDLRQLRARVTRLLATMAAAMLVSFLLAVVLSARLQTVVSGPIKELVAVAEAVSRHKDYSIRVEQRSSDETGMLAHAFNTMLETIEGRDTSLMAAKDEAQAATRAKSAFLATMSHEIRTPMNGVLGMAEVVLMTELSEEQREYVETIQSSGRSLLMIINDILDFSKVEAGELAIERVDFDPRAVVRECSELLGPGAAEKGLTFGYLVAPEVPATVAGDPTRVRQVLLNLLGNALKFTAQGEVAVIVEVAERDGDALLLRFQVHDSGIGLETAVQDRIFHPFSQADESTTRRFGGTGLGLAICRSLTELMGGEIGVDSEQGRGSMFWFTVRVESRPAAVVAPPVSASLEGRRVLIVDDHPINRKILERLLAFWDMRSAVTGVSQDVLGLVAGAIREGDPFDVLLLDRQMPVMNGFDVARQLHEELEGPPPRLILLASEVGPTDQATAETLDFASVLLKPVGQEQLELHLARALSDVDDAPSRDRQARRLSTSPHPIAKPRDVRVLLVEDNRVNRFIAMKILQSRGFEVEEVEDGAAAVEAVAEDRYDLVLMDCQMPILDGYEATRRIRRLEGAPSSIPIVAMTANAMRGDRERCLAAGMDDYISKPLDTDKLFEILEQWTNRRGVEPRESQLGPG